MKMRTIYGIIPLIGAILLSVMIAERTEGITTMPRCAIIIVSDLDGFDQEELEKADQFYQYLLDQDYTDEDIYFLTEDGRTGFDYLAYESPDTDIWSVISLSYTNVYSSDGGDYSQNFPDIAAVEVGEDIILDCVWIENDGYNDEVYYKRSSDGGGSFESQIQIDDDGFMELRSVAVDSFIVFSDPPVKRCHVIWTTGDDVYFRDRIDDGTGDWKSNFEDQENGATTQWEEYFVDVSTSSPDSISITAYAAWGVEGTAVFFGFDP